MLDTKPLSIIIVNYRSKLNLARCLASIYNSEKEKTPELIVVNNDANEKLSDLKKLYPEIVVINHSRNVGYGSANNLGSKIASGKYLFLLNPDTEIVSVDLNLLIDEFQNNGELGIIGIKIINEAGFPQPWSVGKEISWKDLIANNLGLSRSRSFWDKPVKREVDWVSGTAMVIKKELFFDLGGFDENFFMYFEDMDLCRRARKAGKKVAYRPTHIVRHSGGASYAKNSKEQKNDYFRSQDYYFHKHFGKFHSMLLRTLRRTFGK